MTSKYNGQQFAVIDNRNNGQTEEEFIEFYDDLTEAMAEAEAEWNQLSPAEQDPRRGSRSIRVSRIEQDPDDEGMFVEVEDIAEFSAEQVATPRALTFPANVTRQGNTLSVTITKAARMMGLERGDLVKVTVELFDDGLKPIK